MRDQLTHKDSLHSLLRLLQLICLFRDSFASETSCTLSSPVKQILNSMTSVIPTKKAYNTEDSHSRGSIHLLMIKDWKVMLVIGNLLQGGPWHRVSFFFVGFCSCFESRSEFWYRGKSMEVPPIIKSIDVIGPPRPRNRNHIHVLIDKGQVCDIFN